MRLKYNRFNSLKVLAHYDKLEQIATGGMPNPVTWVVYPSNICMYKCGHCIMKSERKDGAVLPKETMQKIVKDAKRLGIKTVIFSGGGEPLANPYTVDTMYELKKNGVRVGLNTNGYLLDEDVAYASDFIRVSVDAANADTYKMVHGMDGWSTINSNLSKIEGKTELGLAFLIRPDNYLESYRFCEWASLFNPEFIHLRPVYTENDQELRLIMPVVSNMKNMIESQYKNAFVRVDKFDGYWTPKLYSKCRATPLIAVLTASGQFTVCQDVFIKFGNYNDQTFEECWNSKEHRDAIESININNCPRCVENGYNEIIENCVLEDGLRKDLL